MGELTRVAVYGTLKRGHYNYERYLRGAVPVANAFVEIPYRMFANRDYPMLVSDDAPHRIRLEVFEVDERKLRELDALELPYGYRRETIHVQELGGDVEIYVYPASPPEDFSLVLSGDWRG